MKKIIDYFVDNSVVVNLLTLLIIFMGTISIFSLNKETFPNVDFNFINVRLAYPGAAAEDVEKLITIEIERQLKEVDGIDEINAMSSEGASIVSLQIDPDYDLDEVLTEVRDALSDIMQKVPEDAESPIISKSSNSKRSLISFGVYGKDEMKLREDTKYIREVFERYSGVSNVDLTGFRDEQFDIQIDLKKIEELDLTLLQVFNAVKDRQVNITAGNLKLAEREKLIRTLKENETVEQIESIVISSNNVGNSVLVKDVATVKRILKEKTREERSDQELAIFVSVSSKASADVLETASWLKEKISALSEERGFKYKEFNDLSFYVERRLGVLSENGIVGIFLVIICLTFFMNLRVSIITALGAPFAFLVAFSMMDSLDITINLISMFGLILVLGMLVDDSIIVAEQYYQNLEAGLSPRKAAKQAAYETVAPVSSTVITTMVAFGSLFFMDGLMGKFMWPVPAVVILCLVASWLECFLILPGHLADFASKVKTLEKDEWYKPLKTFYERSLRLALTHAGKTIAIFVALFIGSLFMAKNMRFELFPGDDVTYAYLNIKGPVGSTFEKTNNILKDMEQVIVDEIKDEELIGFRTITGFQWSRGQTPRVGNHYGSIFIEFTLQDLRKRSLDEILNIVTKKEKKKVGNYVFTLEKIKNGPPSGKPVNVEISSDSMDDLIAASKEIKAHLDAKKEVISSEIDYEFGKKQIIVDIDEAEARRLGVSNVQIATELRAAFEGLTATTIKKSDEDVDIVVRLQEKYRSQENTLKRIRVLNNQGALIPLTRMASFREQDGSFIIRRFNRKRTISISGEVNRKLTTSSQLNKDLKPFLDKTITKYPGMNYMLSGENKDTRESLDSFKKALVASLFLIFIVLVVQFSSLAQPLIIMSAIPFGLIGVVIAFFILGMSLGFMALMGILGLVGVVINDSIVLVSFINQYLKNHGHDMDSLVKASLSRFRPVILTTFTTVVGLLPVAHMPGGDPFLKPMATSFAYGLLFSTSITLIFVPSCYFLYMRFIDRKKSL